MFVQLRWAVKLARPLEAERSGGQEDEQLDQVCDVIHGMHDMNLHDYGENDKIQEKSKSQSDFFCLLHVRSTVHCPTQNICILNSNFIDSGATVDGVSPRFCLTNGLWKNVVDHNEFMEITLAAKQTMTVPTKTVRLTLYMDDFKPYTNDFLVIDVPEEQDLLLGMPWLKTVNPDIDWVNERVKPRVLEETVGLASPTGKKKPKKKLKTPHKPEQPVGKIGGQRQRVSPQKKKDQTSDYYKNGYYSATSGTTKYITSKQFRRILRKPKDIECIFVIRLKTEKESGEVSEIVDIETFRSHPVYPVLVKHKAVFKQKLPSCLPAREHGEHVMEVDTKEAIFRRQWRQSPGQEKVIMDWTREMRGAGLIRPSTSPHGAPTFCVKKPVGWRIVHDYRAMNSHTVRRTLPMPRKDTIIEKMQGAFWYSCMDLLSGYYQFRMRDCDIPYTAFQTPDGAYEYLVLPMGLSNAPATFNEGIRRILTDLSDICQSYFDDIYVYSRSEALDAHLKALDRVLTRLEEHKFYVKLSKCVFCVEEIPCLGDYVGRNGVRIDPKKVKILSDWPLPRTRSELQSFLGTATYVQRFCHDFASDAGPLFDTLKGPAKRTIIWNDKLRSHFQSLKEKISKTPVLAVPDFAKPFGLRMDASDHAIGGVLFQEEVNDDEIVERPVAFGGRKYKDAEKNYSIREKELLAILFGLRLWRVYLLDKPFVVETDHRSLETVFTQKTISRRVARWYDELSEYPITFRYIQGEKNTVADGISRRPDLVQDTVTLAAVSTVKQVHSHIEHGLASLAKEATDRYDADPLTAVLARHLDTQATPTKPQIRHFERYSRQNKQIFYQAPSDEQPRLVLPNIPEIIDSLLYEFHDAKCYGHPGVERTLRLVEKDYYWRNMERSIRAYVRSCEVCQRTKARNCKPPGFLRSHSIPAARWTHLAMDFIVALPETKSGYDAIMVVIDRLTKRAHFLPTTTIATTMEIAQQYRDRIFVLHGLPEEVLSDRDSKFTSALWTTLCSMLGTRQKLTTAFRQQANGITERVNQTIENYLRAFSNSTSDNWDKSISLAEFAYNTRYQSSIGMSPFEADIGYMPATPALPRTTELTHQPLSSDEPKLANEFVEQQKDILARVRRQLQAAQDRMAQYYDRNRQAQELAVGDQVLLSTSNLSNFHAGTTKKKLGPRWIGPYSVAERVGHDYYRLELPTGVKFHPVFHTSLLKPYVASDRPDQELFKVLLPDGTEGEHVEDIVGYRRKKSGKEYHVKWLGQSKLTWEPEENLKYVRGLITRYHQRQRNKTK